MQDDPANGGRGAGVMRPEAGGNAERRSSEQRADSRIFEGQPADPVYWAEPCLKRRVCGRRVLLAQEYARQGKRERGWTRSGWLAD
jgi:hypothetical protein